MPLFMYVRPLSQCFLIVKEFVFKFLAMLVIAIVAVAAVIMFRQTIQINGSLKLISI